jgi:hypothetical protein
VRVELSERWPFIVKISRHGKNLWVELVREMPVRSEGSKPVIAAGGRGSDFLTIVKRQKKLNKAILRAEREADHLNAQEQVADETLKRLALQEAGPE